MNNVVELVERAGERYEARNFSTDVSSRMSFGELRDRAGRYGKIIKELSGRDEPGFPVAIFGDKSNITLSMMFGAVYAGGFYVIMNPEQPEERLNKILEVLKPALLIVSDDLQERAQNLNFECSMTTYGEITSTDRDDSDETYLPKDIPGDSPLYGIFTSGSTGTPKCVLISHRDVIDFIGHFAKAFGFDEEDVIGNQAPFDFDVSVKDIYTALWCGASLMLIPTEYFSTPPRLLDCICDGHVTSLTWAVSALCIISGLKGFDYRVPQFLRRVMFSGEVMPLKQLRIWQENVPDAMYVNLYGPTEITCNCMYYVLPNPYVSEHELPLGRVFPGRKVMLEAADGKVLSGPDSTGEICVAGESLAIGYYNNHEQTEKAFRMEEIDGGDGKQKTVRVYHTGDLARIDENGDMYFAGRKDFQIKHMGHRIELEEIERNVESEPGAERCICSFDDKKKRITAYYTGSIGRKELHLKLKESLPKYMIPNRFRHVSGFELNKNGKIDRHKLVNLATVE